MDEITITQTTINGENIVTHSTDAGYQSGIARGCNCSQSVVILSGECTQHNKKWEARVDADYIKELIEKVKKLELDVRRVELAEPWQVHINKITNLIKYGRQSGTDKQMLELDLATGDGISYKSLRTKNGL
jgi:hypothetical protein